MKHMTVCTRWQLVLSDVALALAPAPAPTPTLAQAIPGASHQLTAFDTIKKGGPRPC